MAIKSRSPTTRGRIRKRWRPPMQTTNIRQSHHPGHLLINWGKYLYHLTRVKNTTRNINQLPPPYNRVTCGASGQILGRAMGPNAEINTAVGEAIRKAHIARTRIRYKIRKYARPERKLAIALRDALVGSVLLYSLRIIPLAQSQLKRTKSWYARRVRPPPPTQDHHKVITSEHTTDQQIRNAYNIPTIEVKLKVSRYRMFPNWKYALSLPPT